MKLTTPYKSERPKKKDQLYVCAITHDEMPAALSRLGRIVLHLRCLWRDHKYRWHLAGVWREVTLH